MTILLYRMTQQGLASQCDPTSLMDGAVEYGHWLTETWLVTMVAIGASGDSRR